MVLNGLQPTQLRSMATEHTFPPLFPSRGESEQESLGGESDLDSLPRWRP